MAQTKINVIGANNMFASANDTVDVSANARRGPGLTYAVKAQITKTDRWKVLGYGYQDGTSDADSAKWYALESPSGSVLYVRKDKLKFYTIESPSTYTETDLNTFLTDIKNVDASIFLRLLQCAELIKQAQAAGVSVKNAYLTKLKTLNNRLAARQKLLTSSSLLSVQSAFNTSWTTAFNAYKSILSNIGAAAVSSSPLIIGAIAVSILATGGVTAWSLYQMLKPTYEEAVVDLSQSETLKKALASLTPNEQNDVVNDLEKQIDDAYNQGKNEAGLNSYVVPILVAAGAVAGLYIISKKKK